MVLVAFIGGLGGQELLLLLALALVIFGPRRLPEIAGRLARATMKLRQAGRDFQREMYRSIDDEQPPSPRPSGLSVESAADPEHESAPAADSHGGEKSDGTDDSVGDQSGP